MYPDEDRFKGNSDLSRASNGFYKAANAEACCELCSTTSGCTGFSFATPTCYFKKPEGPPQPPVGMREFPKMDGVTSGMVKGWVGMASP